MKKGLKRIFKWIINGVPVYNVKVTVSTSYPNQRLKGKHVIITGGGRGLGYYIAKRCQEEGASILIVGRNEDTLKYASLTLNNCPYIAKDLLEVASFSELVNTAANKLGGVDCLINNAGISLHEQSYFDVTEDTFDRQFSTNLKAPYFLTQEVIKYTKEHGVSDVNILFITSERGLYGDTIPYGLTKAAINSLTKGLARRFVNDGIRVNAIAPGVTASDMTGFNKEGNLYRENSCGKRVFIPEEIAEAAIYLLSKESNCVTGEVLPCNQGNHLRSDY